MKKIFIIVFLITTAFLLVLIKPIYTKITSDPVDAKLNKVKIDLLAFKEYADEYHTKTGKYPIDLQHLLNSRIPSYDINRQPTDPWGRPYQYKIINLNGSQRIYIWTYGADGKPGGTDQDRDLSTDTDWSFLK